MTYNLQLLNSPSAHHSGNPLYHAVFPSIPFYSTVPLACLANSHGIDDYRCHVELAYECGELAEDFPTDFAGQHITTIDPTISGPPGRRTPHSAGYGDGH